MKSILVPTDFSAYAKNAMNFAVAMAKKEKAKVVLLHAFNITYLSPDVPLEYLAEQLAATETEAAKILNILCQKVRAESGISCEFLNKEGSPVEIVLDEIHKINPDFVVMGTKGANGLKEVIGSNTAKVIAQASCPVIAIPDKAEFNGLKKIVYATDYHHSDVDALVKLTELAHFFKSEIEILHISDMEKKTGNEEEEMEKFKTLVKSKIDYKNINYKILFGKDIESKLEAHLYQEEISMVATSTRYRNFIERVFGRSITKKLAYHSKIPLLAFHYQDAPLVYI